MKKVIAILILFTFTFTACGTKQKPKLIIAVAANMQFAVKELSTAFTNQTGINCDLIIGSSGKLTAQIKEGAPFDIFVSANMKYPEELYKSGFSIKKPEIYAFGKLVIWSMIDSIKPSLEILKNKDIKHIALANPKTAPYGIATIQVLKHHHIYEDLKNKLVFGENISQTNQFIISKSAEIGFTAESVVLSTKVKGKGNWVEVNKDYYSPISQGVVILKNNPKRAESEKFYKFLFSNNAIKILKKFGYSVQQNQQ